MSTEGRNPAQMDFSLAAHPNFRARCDFRMRFASSFAFYMAAGGADPRSDRRSSLYTPRRCVSATFLPGSMPGGIRICQTAPFSVCIVSGRALPRLWLGNADCCSHFRMIRGEGPGMFVTEVARVPPELGSVLWLKKQAGFIRT